MLVSLCVLAYKRPQWLIECIESIHHTTDIPYELIVNSDADSESAQVAYDLYKNGQISKVILTAGFNRGVGRSLENCISISEGDIIFKVDTDLLFEDDWLSCTLDALATPKVVAVSPFNYRNYDPNDQRFVIEDTREDCYIVNDFVSSIYGFEKKYYFQYMDAMPDDGFHQWLKNFGQLAITKKDYIRNRGFGEDKSVYITKTESGTIEKTRTHSQPLVFTTKT